MSSFTFDEGGFRKKMLEAAEKKFKETILEKLRRPGCSNVKVTFSGSVERNDLKANLDGPADEVAEAKKRLKP
jgi:hypothetical protein